MICDDCARAADMRRPEWHKQCRNAGRADNSHCDCQHREGVWMQQTEVDE